MRPLGFVLDRIPERNSDCRTFGGSVFINCVHESEPPSFREEQWVYTFPYLVGKPVCRLTPVREVVAHLRLPIVILIALLLVIRIWVRFLVATDGLQISTPGIITISQI